MKKSKNDFLLALSFIILGVLLLVIFNVTKQKGKFVEVSIDGKVKDTYNISEYLTKEIINGEFSNTLIIKNGKVDISTANCRDKICVNHRKIENVGETIVCLPHKLVITVTDGDNANEKP